MTLPANRLCNVRRRVNRARKDFVNTCAASRHVHIIAERLAAGDTWWFEEHEEAMDVAGSLYAVLESLWKARTELARLKAK